MHFQLNQTLQLKGGVALDPGAVVKTIATFDSESNDVTLRYEVYASQAAKDAGEAPIQVKGIPSYKKITLTNAQKNSIFNLINAHVKSDLEGYVGVDNATAI